MTALLEAGVDVVRVNASHGTPGGTGRCIAELKAAIAARSAAASAAVLLDLHGPRIRVGRLPEPLAARGRSESGVRARSRGAAPGEIPTTYAALAQDVKAGSTILLNDGLLNVEVTSVKGDRVYGKVRYGGELSANKGMNLPGVQVSAPAVTDKDREEIARAVEWGVDYLGRLVRPQAGRPRGGTAPGAGAYEGGRQDRKGHGARPPHGDRARLRRHHGGAGRSRRGAAIRRGAARAEAGDPRSQPARQARDHGDPDARVHGARAPARRGPRPRTSPTPSSTAPTP